MTLKLGLLGFWTLWFAIVTATNMLGVSSNYAAIVRATQKYAPPQWLPRVLFGAVIAWQAATTALLARAVVLSLSHDAIDLDAATLALGSGIALWAAFMLADEITLKYEFERTHELLFVAQLATLVALHLLP
jgi:hypothetical protein